MKELIITKVLKEDVPGYDPRFLSIEIWRDRQTDSGYKERNKKASKSLSF